MKALTIRQPWAWLIMHGGKDIENRTWPTTLRGRVLVHAAKGCTYEEYEDGMDFAYDLLPLNVRDTIPLWCNIERGGVVGSVLILDCVRQWDSPWFFGPHGFVLSHPNPIPFTPCKGALGFWDCSAIAAGQIPAAAPCDDRKTG